IAGTPIYSELNDNEIIISRNLAEKLETAEGEFILIQIKKASLIPMNAPFVSDEEVSVSLRAVVKKIVDKEEMGSFNLKTSQTAPYNIFVSLNRLNRLMEFEGKANHLLVATTLDNNEVQISVKNSLTPADAGLKMKSIEATGEIEISTERVFMEPKVAQTLDQFPGANPIISYFVNGIGLNNPVETAFVALGEENGSGLKNSGKEIPYSFVSSLSGAQLRDDEIILTQ